MGYNDLTETKFLRMKGANPVEGLKGDNNE
jgi:hypothetical protein